MIFGIGFLRLNGGIVGLESELVHLLCTMTLLSPEFQVNADQGWCGQHNDVATASSTENWIDEAESRVWFLALVQA